MGHVTWDNLMLVLMKWPSRLRDKKALMDPRGFP